MTAEPSSDTGGGQLLKTPHVEDCPLCGRLGFLFAESRTDVVLRGSGHQPLLGEAALQRQLLRQLRRFTQPEIPWPHSV